MKHVTLVTEREIFKDVFTTIAVCLERGGVDADSLVSLIKSCYKKTLSIDLHEILYVWSIFITSSKLFADMVSLKNFEETQSAFLMYSRSVYTLSKRTYKCTMHIHV